MSVKREPNMYFVKRGEFWAWQPNSKDRKKNCPLVYTNLGADPIEAISKARELNAALKEWRSGTVVSHEPGTFSWVFEEFQKHGIHNKSDGYKAEVARYAVILSDMPTSAGKTLGRTDLQKITVKLANAIYRKVIDTRGQSTANKAVAIASSAWTKAFVLNEHVVPERNPFHHVERTHDEKETVPATYDEMISFVSAAIAMGESAHAFAARAIWDLHIRPSEIFNSTTWEHFTPEAHPDDMFIGVEKTSKGKKAAQKSSIWMPIYWEDDGERICLHPELVDLSRMLPTREGQMCVRERRKGVRVYSGTWEPIKRRAVISITAAIRKRAGLDEHVTMAAFRHGGLTDAGSVSDNVKARSRHKQRATLDRYVHSSRKQAAEIQLLRLKARNS